MRLEYKVSLVAVIATGIFLYFTTPHLVSFFILTAKYVKLFYQSGLVVDPGVIVIANEFDGNTTEFLYVNDEAVEWLTLENTTNGKIVFLENINLTADKDENNFVWMDGNVEIKNNSIYVNTSALTSLQKAAMLYIYNLNLTDPAILRNGQPCPSDFCHILSYENGTLSFMVNQLTYDFTAFSGIERSELPQPPPPSGPGMGGYTPTPVVMNYTVDRDFIKVSVKQGETATETFEVRNTGNTDIGIVIENIDLKNLVSVEQKFFFLEPNEIKTVKIAFTARENETPDIYSGNLLIRGDGIEKRIFMVMEVKEKRPLFDVQLVLDKIPYEVFPGDYAEGDIVIYNFGEVSPVDVTLHYALRDISRNELFFGEETFMVVEQKLVRKKIKIPSDIKPGYYLSYAKVTYDGQAATSSGLIRVMAVAKEKAPAEPYFLEFLIGITWICIMIVLLFVVLIYRRAKKMVFETHPAVPAEGKTKIEPESNRAKLDRVNRELENLMYMIRMLREKSTENEVVMQSGKEKTVNVNIRNISKTYMTIDLHIEGLPESWYEIERDSEYSTKTGSYARFKVTFKPPSTVRRGEYRFFYAAEVYGAKETSPAVLRIFETEEETLMAEIEVLKKQVREIRSLIESGKSMGKDMSKAEKMVKMIDESIKKVEGEFG